jgi:hypothetical protein
MTGVVPNDYWVLLLEPLYVALRLVPWRVDGIALIDRTNWNLVVILSRYVFG